MSETQETETQNPKKWSVTTVDDEPHPEDSVDFLQSSSKLYESNYSSDDDNMMAIIHNYIGNIEPFLCLSKSVNFPLLYSLTPEVLVAF